MSLSVCVLNNGKIVAQGVAAVADRIAGSIDTEIVAFSRNKIDVRNMLTMLSSGDTSTLKESQEI